MFDFYVINRNTDIQKYINIEKNLNTYNIATFFNSNYILTNNIINLSSLP